MFPGIHEQVYISHFPLNKSNRLFLNHFLIFKKKKIQIQGLKDTLHIKERQSLKGVSCFIKMIFISKVIWPRGFYRNNSSKCRRINMNFEF